MVVGAFIRAYIGRVCALNKSWSLLSVKEFALLASFELATDSIFTPAKAYPTSVVSKWAGDGRRHQAGWVIHDALVDALPSQIVDLLMCLISGN